LPDARFALISLPSGRHRLWGICDRDNILLMRDGTRMGKKWNWKKQVRLGPATQAALLSRMILTAVFCPKEKIVVRWRSKECRVSTPA
jgi:hypothetical protein